MPDVHRLPSTAYHSVLQKWKLQVSSVSAPTKYVLHILYNPSFVWFLDVKSYIIFPMPNNHSQLHLFQESSDPLMLCVSAPDQWSYDETKWEAQRFAERWPLKGGGVWSMSWIFADLSHSMVFEQTNWIKERVSKVNWERKGEGFFLAKLTVL